MQLGFCAACGRDERRVGGRVVRMEVTLIGCCWMREVWGRLPGAEGDSARAAYSFFLFEPSI
jgi:hypothetical protein